MAKFLLPLHPTGSLLHQLAERQQRSEMLGRAYTKVGYTKAYTKVAYNKVGDTKVAYTKVGDTKVTLTPRWVIPRWFTPRWVAGWQSPEKSNSPDVLRCCRLCWRTRKMSAAVG